MQLPAQARSTMAQPARSIRAKRLTPTDRRLPRLQAGRAAAIADRA